MSIAVPVSNAGFWQRLRMPSLSRYTRVWLACGVGAVVLAHTHRCPFDPVRMWLLLGWLGFLWRKRFEVFAPASGPVDGAPQVRVLPILPRWAEWLVHGAVVLFLIRHDPLIFGTIERHAVPAAAHFFFALGEGFVDVALLVVIRFLGARDASNTGLRAAFNACVNAQLLKSLFGRAWPNCGAPIAGEFTGAIGLPWHDSFPSGHTSSAFAVAGALAYHYPRQRWIFYVVATIVGFCTVVTRTHWMGDAYAGALVGVMSARQAALRRPNLLGVTV